MRWCAPTVAAPVVIHWQQPNKLLKKQQHPADFLLWGAVLPVRQVVRLTQPVAVK